MAIADLNDDGLLDIVINNNNAAPAIYLNRLSDAGHWLRVRLTAREANVDAIGARVQVVIDGDGSKRRLTRWVEAGTGYAAQSDLRPHFGLGNCEQIESLSVRWPDGSCEQFDRDNLAGRINSTIHIQQGHGIVGTAAGIVADPSGRRVRGAE